MKYLILCLLLSSTCLAQSIPKGAYAIVLKSSSEDSLIMKRTLSELLLKEYSFETVDFKHGSIVANGKANDDHMRVRIVVNVNSGTATFKSQYTKTTMGVTYKNEPLLNEHGEEKKAFERMDDIVKKVSQKIDTPLIDYVLLAKL